MMLYEEIPVVMSEAFFGHKQDSELHVLDLAAMLGSPYWDLAKCGKMGKFKEATGKELNSTKCAKCFEAIKN